MDQNIRLRPRNRGMDPKARRRAELTAIGAVAVLALCAWGASLLFATPSPVGKLASLAAGVATAAVPAAVATPAADATPSTVAVAPSTAATVTPTAPAVAKSAVTTTPAAKATAKAAGFVVVIDAGHQAHADLKPEPIGPGSKTTKPAVAGGTSGVSTHAPESLINLRVALRLRKALQARGIKVIMVRTSQNVDIPNSKRAKMANAAHAGLLIRLHCDGASSSSVAGLLTLVPGRNAWTGPILSASARAGRDIHAAAITATGARNRGITPRSDMSGFNWSKVPSVIVEMGLMTNPAEDRRLSTASYQQKLADGMAAGIARFAAGK